MDSVKTKDVINFWLSNAKDCDIVKYMSRDFKPVFVYHLVSILFYMANMYNEKGLAAPRSLVFSGNGSKYVDNFISSDSNVLKKIVDMVFGNVFGGEHDVNIKLPEERKESTCYGGLYRDKKALTVKEIVYQGDLSRNYETVADMTNNLDSLKASLLTKYKKLAELYKMVLDLLKQERVIDGTLDTVKYVNKANENMGTPFTKYYRTQVKEKYGEEVVYNDSVFFLPVINKVFEMTKI